MIVHSAAAGEAFVELTQGVAATPSTSTQCCGPIALPSATPIAPALVDLRIVATTPAAAAALASLGVEVWATASAAAADAVVDAALEALSEVK